MKLMFICNEYPPAPHGGIGTFVSSLARNLVDLGHQVSVVGFDFTIKHSLTTVNDGVQVTRLCSPFRKLPTQFLGRYRNMPAFLGERLYLSSVVDRFVRDLGIDIVESYDWSGPLWRKPRVPLVVRLHGSGTAHGYYEGCLPSALTRIVEGRNVKAANRIVAVSNHIQEMTLRSMGIDNNKYDQMTIYNGVDTTVFRKMPVQKSEFEVLFVGTVSRRKGIFDLFQAIPEVIRNIPQARFTIIGRLPKGEDQKRLLVQILSLLPDHVRKHVQFLGSIPHQELPYWYSRATLCVFPSHVEAFGLTCVEAMACETAVIMTNKASGPEIVEDGISGLLTDPSQHNILAEKIVTLLQRSDFRQIITINARKKVVLQFNLKEQVRINAKMFESLLDSSAD